MNLRRPGAALMLVACMSCRKASPPSDPERTASPAPPASAAAPHRCSAIPGAQPLLLPSTGGEGARGTPRPTPDAGKRPSGGVETPDDESLPGEPAEDLLPYATEVGEGTTYAGGFAVGVIRAEKGSPVLGIARLGPAGEDAGLVTLGRAIGDIEPPRVVGAGERLFFGVLEPQPNGRSLRIGRLDGGSVTWGPTLPAHEGESQAFDLAASDKKLLAVWDDERADGAGIEASTIDLATFAATPPRRLSPEDKDTDTPRIITRPGGFWLAYIARRDSDGTGGAPYAAEDIGHRWIEIVPLDLNGSPTGRPRSVSSLDGHVMLFDMAQAPDGGALLVWRDEDTSTGSGGGRVLRAVVRLADVQPASVLIDADVGPGAPKLLEGWLSVTDSADATRLSPLRAAGELAGEPAVEPEIGLGEPLAALGGVVLVARPAGRDMKLETIRCERGSDNDAAP